MCNERDGLIETVVALTIEHDMVVHRDEIAKKGLAGSLSTSLFRSVFPLYKRDTPPPFPVVERPKEPSPPSDKISLLVFLMPIRYNPQAHRFTL